MPGEAQALGVLANLLALPKSVGEEAEQADRDRYLLGLAAPELGLGPGDVDALAPQPTMRNFPGVNVPVVGHALKGIGAGGRMLQQILGTAPAPRPPLEELMKLAEMRSMNAYRTDLMANTAADNAMAERRYKLAERDTAARELRANRTGLGGGGGGLGKMPWEAQGLTAEQYRDWKENRGIPAAIKPFLPPKPLQDMTPDDFQGAINKANANRVTQVTDESAARGAVKTAFDVKKDIRKLDQAAATIKYGAEQVLPGLTTNPLWAKSGAQTVEQFLKAAEGDPAAVAMRNLVSNTPVIARSNLEVGNLSGPEQQIYRAYLTPEKMTLQEFAAGINFLMGTWAARRKQLVESIPALRTAESMRLVAPPRLGAGDYSLKGQPPPPGVSVAVTPPSADGMPNILDPAVDDAINFLNQ